MEISSVTSGSSGSSLLTALRRPSEEELAKLDAQMSEALIKAKDGDGDGSLSSSELGVDTDQFAAVDTDGDGLATQAELTASLQAKREELFSKIQSLMDEENAQALQSGGPPPPPPSEEEMAAHEAEMASDLVSELDTDGDGVLSMSELGLDEETFAAIDADGDGLATTDEITADMAANRPEPPGRDVSSSISSSEGQETDASALGLIGKRAAAAYQSQADALMSLLFGQDQGELAVA